jgi:hypothetical protein
LLRTIIVANGVVYNSININHTFVPVFGNNSVSDAISMLTPFLFGTQVQIMYSNAVAVGGGVV